MIGEDFWQYVEMFVQKVCKEVVWLVMGVDIDVEEQVVCKVKVILFGGRLKFYQYIEDVQLLIFMLCKGSELQFDVILFIVESMLLSYLVVVKIFWVCLDGVWSFELMFWFKFNYFDGVLEDQFDSIVEQLQVVFSWFVLCVVGGNL